MTENSRLNKDVSTRELASLRQSVTLLQSQIKGGRVDGAFLAQQMEVILAALDKLDADRKARQNTSRFEALYNVTRLLGSSLDMQTVLDQVMDAIIQLTGAERGFLMLRDSDGGVAVQAARNLDQKSITSDQFKYSRTIVYQVLDSGQPIVTTNAVEDPRFAGQASIVGQALRSIMATPLHARGKVIGVVYVDNRGFAGIFDQNDLEALDTFAGQAAVALENARLFSATDQQLAERVEELTQLRRLDTQLNATLDANKALQVTLEWICRLTDSSGYLGLIEGEPKRIRIAHSFGVNPRATQLTHLEIAYPAALRVIDTGVTRVVDGTSGIPSALMVPLRREQQPIGIAILTRDTGVFTPRQQDLVERIAARAAVALENARLYAAVQAADKAKSEFVGIVAHDLKVPMTSMLGYANLTLMEGSLSERQVLFQNKITDTVRRMEMLVSDLADISRIESGQFFMNPTKVAVKDVTQAVKDTTANQIAERKHRYVEQIEADLPPIYIDYYRLVQVLTNFVSNAYKYTPDGGTITLSAKKMDDKIEFSVADSGIGLPPEALQKLGTRFWRAEDDFTRSQPGTGLGFAITRSLVEQMGGHIEIESEVGKGSRFTFRIPVGAAPQEQPPSVTAP